MAHADNSVTKCLELLPFCCRYVYNLAQITCRLYIRWQNVSTPHKLLSFQSFWSSASGAT